MATRRATLEIVGQARNRSGEIDPRHNVVNTMLRHYTPEQIKKLINHAPIAEEDRAEMRVYLLAKTL